jgi:hypothetical protein
MKDNLKSIWREAVVANFKAPPWNCGEGQRNTTENNQYSRCPGRVPPEHKSRAYRYTNLLSRWRFILSISATLLSVLYKLVLSMEDQKKYTWARNVCLRTGPWTNAFPTASFKASYLSARERIYKYKCREKLHHNCMLAPWHSSLYSQSYTETLFPK